MADDPPDQLFVNYLTCDLPGGYPLPSPLVPTPSAPVKERHRKDLLYQQLKFLQDAEQLLATHPWIAFLAVLKHEAVVGAVPRETLQFLDVADQRYFNDGQLNWKALRKEAQSGLDETTCHYCERLILLQCEASKMDEAEKTIQGAIGAGYTRLEPLPPKPPEPARGFGAWIVNAIRMSNQKSGAKTTRAALKAWHLQETYHRLCGKALKSISSLPAEIRNDGLTNLPACLNALAALRTEREALEANYITPYLN